MGTEESEEVVWLYLINDIFVTLLFCIYPLRTWWFLLNKTVTHRHDFMSEKNNFPPTNQANEDFHCHPRKGCESKLKCTSCLLTNLSPPIKLFSIFRQISHINQRSPFTIRSNFTQSINSTFLSECKVQTNYHLLSSSHTHTYLARHTGAGQTTRISINKGSIMSRRLAKVQ